MGLSALEKKRRDLLTEVEEHLAAAADDHSHSAVSTMLRLKRDLQGLSQPPPPTARRATIPKDPLRYVDQLLREVQNARSEALAAKSFVAASKLMSQELELVEKRLEILREREPPKEVDPAALMQRIEDALRAMPDHLCDEILRRVRPG